MPDEPTAVVITGTDAGGRSAVLGALVGLDRPVAATTPCGYVVVRHRTRGPADGCAPAGPCSAPARPPRRVDVALAHPLLRHLVLVDAPAADRLGVAGRHVLVDVAACAGAAVHVLRCGDRLTVADVEVLSALVRAGVAVFFALTPDSAGRWRGPRPRGGRIELPDCDDPAAAAIDIYRRAVTTRLPPLGDAPWHTVDPPAADAAYLRQALTDWADAEGLRRAADSLSATPRVIAIPGTPAGSRWQDRLDEVHHGAAYAVRHHLGVELAGLHLRCAQHLDRTGDPLGLLWLLDTELQALALHTDAVTHQVLTRIVDEVLVALLTDGLPDGARTALCAALRNRIPADEVARALLVTPAGGVLIVPGQAAVTALRAYPAGADQLILPRTGVGLAGECWRLPALQNADEAPLPVERAVSELETVLSEEIERRFRVVRRVLEQVVAGAVHAGILAS
jgi:hypothetical protein